MTHPPLPPGFSPRRILVLQQRQIGDVLLATPAVAAIRRRFPEAEIHFLTESKCADMLVGNPDIDRIIPMDKRRLRGLAAFAWYWSTARQGYDLVIDFQSLPRLKWITLFSGAPIRFAATRKRRTSLIYNAFPDPICGGYAAWEKVDLLSALGIENLHEPPKLILSDAELKAADAFLAGLGLKPGERLVTLDVTHRRPGCKWPAAYFAKAVGILHAAHPSLRFLAFWGPGERDQAMEMFDDVPPEARSAVMRIPDVQPLRMIAACIARASLHLGNCSAPQHMAAALGTRACIVVGATGPAWHCPTPGNTDVAAGLHCQFCHRHECPDGYPCLKGLMPDTVAKAAMDLLETPPRTS